MNNKYALTMVLLIGLITLTQFVYADIDSNMMIQYKMDDDNLSTSITMVQKQPATTTVGNYKGISFVSEPLAAQTIASGTWTAKTWNKESAAGGNYYLKGSLYQWIDSSNLQGTQMKMRIGDAAELTTTLSNRTITFTNASAVTLNAGDKLVFELDFNSKTSTLATTIVDYNFDSLLRDGNLNSPTPIILSDGSTTSSLHFTNLGVTGSAPTDANSGDTFVGSTTQSFYLMQRKQKGVINDSTNNNNNGLTSGGVLTQINGYSGNAYLLNGTTQYITAKSNIVSTGLSAVSVSMWTSIDELPAAGYQTIFALDDLSAAGEAIFEVNDAANGDGCDAAARLVLFLVGNVGSVVNCYPVPTADTWHHYTVVFDYTQTTNAEVKLYIDGNLQTAYARTSSENTGTFSSKPFRLAASIDASQPLDGNIDEVRYYNRGLSASEVTDLYNYYTGGSATTCTYGGSGNWLVNLADNCNLTTDTNILGNKFITYGTGSLILNAWIFGCPEAHLIGTNIHWMGKGFK